MKILCFIDNLGSGGAQRQLTTIAALLKKRDFDISFLVYHEDDFFKEKLDQLGIPVNYVLEKRSCSRILKIRKFIRKGHYDVVVSFMETPNFLNCLSAIGGKTWKVITSERSANPGTFLSLRGKLFAWFQRYSDVLVCNSYNSKIMWENYYPRYKNKLSVIYNPVLLPKIASEYFPKRNGKLNIVIVASYQYLKNPIGVIKALILMNDEERGRFEINWYGRIEVVQGDRRAYKESVLLIREHNLDRTIFLNEATKEVADKMNEADVVALFSELEGLPNVICEGMMIGKPIIMTRVSDSDTLIDRTNGILCDWENPKDIKRALLEAFDWNSSELKQKGERSKEKAKYLFAQDNIIQKWINCFS